MASEKYESVLVCQIMSKRTNMKTINLEDAMIKRYRLELNMIKNDIDNINNNFTLSAVNVICFRCENKGHQSNKYNEIYTSNKVNIKYSKFTSNCNMCGKKRHITSEFLKKEKFQQVSC